MSPRAIGAKLAMNVSLLSSFQDGIFVVTIQGDYSSQDLGDVIIAGYSQAMFTTTTSILMDARRSTANRSSHDIWLTSDRIVKKRPKGHSGRWAIVVGEGPFRFALGRMGA